MVVKNSQQAVHWFPSASYITFRNGRFIKEGFWGSLGRFVNRKHHKREVEKVISAAQKAWTISPSERSRNLAESCIHRYRSSKAHAASLKALDRSLIHSRKKQQFVHPELEVSFAKWKRNGFCTKIFLDHPEFADFLVQSRLLFSQIKIFKNTENAIKIVGGQPALLVEGTWTKWRKVEKRFSTKKPPGSRETFLIDTATQQVYTYLDNGKGLQPFHPHLQETFEPITTLTNKEYQYTLKKAREFIRLEEKGFSLKEREKKNKKRTFILQIVTSTIKTLNTNATNTIIRVKHGHVRMISGGKSAVLNGKLGSVYAWGFLQKRKTTRPFVATQGHFRFPDTHEYLSCPEKVVTSIAMTAEEADAFCRYTMGYHLEDIKQKEEIGFSYREQNCSTYIQAAAAAANVTIPTQLPLLPVIAKISPDWMRSIGRSILALQSCAKKTLSKCATLLLPYGESACAQLARAISRFVHNKLKAIAPIFLSPFRALAGGFSGKGGKAFAHKKKKRRRVEITVSNWRKHFTFSSYRYNLPSFLQEWQKKQPSTVIYKNHIKLPIVPLNSSL